jgi:hypothetical protein
MIRAMAKLLYRLFGVGKMPDGVRSEFASENVLYLAEGIRVSLNRSGHVPVVSVGAGVNVGVGAFAVTDRRVIGTRGRAKWVDVPSEVTTNGPATLTLDGTGPHVRFDLDRVHPSFQGEMRIDFRQELSESDLARFPARELSFPVDPQKVMRLFGSLRKLPDPDQSAGTGGSGRSPEA